MEAEIRDEVDKSSKNPEETKLARVVKHSSGGENGDSILANRSDGEEEGKGASMSNGEFVVDVKKGRSRNSGLSSKSEKVCRICHFGSEPFSSGSGGGLELVPLGCDCRGELGLSHRYCAEAWFSQRTNRLCEICGKTAENVSSNSAEEISIFMMEWNEMRMVAATLDNSRESSRRCKQSFCNFLLGCLILAFVLPWFFRGMDLLQR